MRGWRASMEKIRLGGSGGVAGRWRSTAGGAPNNRWDPTVPPARNLHQSSHPRPAAPAITAGPSGGCRSTAIHPRKPSAPEQLPVRFRQYRYRATVLSRPAADSRPTAVFPGGHRYPGRAPAPAGGHHTKGPPTPLPSLRWRADSGRSPPARMSSWPSRCPADEPPSARRELRGSMLPDANRICIDGRCTRCSQRTRRSDRGRDRWGTRRVTRPTVPTRPRAPPLHPGRFEHRPRRGVSTAVRETPIRQYLVASRRIDG